SEPRQSWSGSRDGIEITWTVHEYCSALRPVIQSGLTSPREEHIKRRRREDTMIRAALRSATFFCSIFALAYICSGQTYTGGLTGAVNDPAGALVPSASLKLTNLETNDVRQQSTNETGAYNFTALPPGRYRMEVEHPGFK